ncbi:hypothetical protein E1A91_D13G019400v1 [Gossypium mustelinum]|uniref:RNase H type-1 domain-containing protein n=4 Tax=Gossypium TaxID=3633 RepID=A0A5J5NG24_GOSBA|nr:hypothetical protein ES319_D13G018900v1 [Gossypium barbadense]TYG35892.1 hypothetical protein ES288_D13G020000v1 [Gossypium darwinii]TYH32847.1 hypothetical protein ES332_D13G018500v1 [Gossypium tomentosum]TYI45193.1 hypothetical protein E1A91_D13G019400v1 [Gossypium mustelinum]
MGIAPLHGSVNDFVAQMLVEQHNDKRRRVLGMLWDIWFSRNMMVWKQNFMSADRLVHYVDERMVHTSQSIRHPVIVKGDACWCKPTSEMVKYNVGGAIFVDSGYMGMGWVVVVRNGVGGCVKSISSFMISNPFITKVFVVHKVFS